MSCIALKHTSVKTASGCPGIKGTNTSWQVLRSARILCCHLKADTDASRVSWARCKVNRFSYELRHQDGCTQKRRHHCCAEGSWEHDEHKFLQHTEKRAAESQSPVLARGYEAGNGDRQTNKQTNMETTIFVWKMTKISASLHPNPPKNAPWSTYWASIFKLCYNLLTPR